jgi:hypothetical protein
MFFFKYHTLWDNQGFFVDALSQFSITEATWKPNLLPVPLSIGSSKNAQDALPFSTPLTYAIWRMKHSSENYTRSLLKATDSEVKSSYSVNVLVRLRIRNV